MIEYHKINVSNSVSGIIETESCIFSKVHGCKISEIECRLSSTEIVVPKLCPLRSGDVNITVSLKKYYTEEH